MTPITAGLRVKIVKGCKARNMNKGATYLVSAVTELGADYSHAVRVTLQRLQGFGPDRVSFTARHINRLSDPTVRMNDGNPSNVIEVQRVKS
jgi:hypothetical protein